MDTQSPIDPASPTRFILRRKEKAALPPDVPLDTRGDPILDAIELNAKAEDIALVTGKRNYYKEAGLKSQLLTFKSFRDFFKAFNVLEYKCPPSKRTSDEDLMQIVSNLFIKDPSMRKLWTEKVNAPEIYDSYGLRGPGPPQLYGEGRGEGARRGASPLDDCHSRNR